MNKSFINDSNQLDRLGLIWSWTHLIPGLLVSHFLSPWTNGPQKFGPHRQMVPNQFGPPEQIQEDQISWGPFVYGDRIWWGRFVQGDRLSRVSGSGGPEIRGSNGFGTKCVAAKISGFGAFSLPELFKITNRSICYWLILSWKVFKFQTFFIPEKTYKIISRETRSSTNARIPKVCLNIANFFGAALWLATKRANQSSKQLVLPM